MDLKSAEEGNSAAQYHLAQTTSIAYYNCQYTV